MSHITIKSLKNQQIRLKQPINQLMKHHGNISIEFETILKFYNLGPGLGFYYTQYHSTPFLSS